MVSGAQHMHLFTVNEIFKKHNCDLNCFCNDFRLLSWLIITLIKYFKDVRQNLLKSNLKRRFSPNNQKHLQCASPSLGEVTRLNKGSNLLNDDNCTLFILFIYLPFERTEAILLNKLKKRATWNQDSVVVNDVVFTD